MRVLTVRQPWAWAIMHGGKDVENRTKNIAGDYRGAVAIHVGLREDINAFSDLDSESLHALDAAADSWLNELTADQAQRGFTQPWWTQHGRIIGVVNLWAVHPDRDGGNCCPHRPSGGPGGSPWSERGAWHLCVDDPRSLIEPIPFRGGLGLRTLPADIEAKVLEGLA